MNSRIFAYIILIMLSGYLISIAGAGEKSGLAETKYYELLNRVKNQKPDVNFAELRMTYAQSPLYQPYNFDNDELTKKMYQAFNDSNYAEAVGYALEALTDNYLFIDAHIICMTAYELIDSLQKSAYHRYVADGLISSILDSGDGLSESTAYEIICIQEEKTILYYFDLEMRTQSLDFDDEGNSYDIFEAVNPETKESRMVYFNNTRMLGYLNKLLENNGN